MSIKRLPTRDPEKTVRVVACDASGCIATISARKLRERQLDGHLGDWAKLDDRHYCARHAIELLKLASYVDLRWWLEAHPEHQVDPAWVDERIWEHVEGIDLSSLEPDHGRGLDVRIARDVLGLTLRQKRKPAVRSGEMIDVFDYLDASGRWQPIHHYAADAGATLKRLLPALRARGLWLTMSDNPDATDPDNEWLVAVMNGMGRPMAEVTGPLPRAICLAALEAVTAQDGAGVPA